MLLMGIVKNVSDLIVTIIVAILSIILLLLSFLFVVLLYPFSLLQRNKSEADFSYYLKSINGAKFFCYSNKKSTVEFVEQQIVPFLSSDIEIVFLKGKTPKMDNENIHISQILYRVKGKPPWLIKIENGHVRYESINNELHNTIAQSKSPKLLLKKMNNYFLNQL